MGRSFFIVELGVTVFWFDLYLLAWKLVFWFGSYNWFDIWLTSLVLDDFGFEAAVRVSFGWAENFSFCENDKITLTCEKQKQGEGWEEMSSDIGQRSHCHWLVLPFVQLPCLARNHWARLPTMHSGKILLLSWPSNGGWIGGPGPKPSPP